MAVVVVGDVVDSRRYADQRRLLDGVADAAAGIGALDAAMTVGDEFQASFPDLPSAVRALASLRLALLDDPPADRPVEIRCGIGVGDVEVAPGAGVGAPGQSGPGWWAARAALEHVAADRRAWPRLRWWVAGEGDLAPVRAVLVALDALAAGFDAVDVSLARGLLDGASASALADAVGLTRQSVSARLHDHGVYGWVRTIETLTEETTG